MASGKTLQSTIEISGVLSPNLQKAINKAVGKLEEMSKETLDSADAASRLVAEMDQQEEILKTMQKAYAGYVASGEKSSEAAENLAKRIETVSGELKENRDTLKNAEKAAQDLDRSLEDAGDGAEKSCEGFTILKGAISDLVADGIGKAVDAFKELATEGDTALAMLEARTGATGQTMEGFEDVLYEVYNANYGESLGDVSEKLSTVIQMTDDLDNASLAKVTKSAIALEDVFGFDVKESLRAANSLMDQFGITSDEAFNLIVQGAQNGLDQNGDLLDTINEYSVQFKNAGYSADDMFNMLANGVDAGTWSVDKLGDAVKEMNIRLSDGTADEALQKLGFGFEEAAVDAEALERAALGISKAEANLTTAQWEANQALRDYGANSNTYKKALNNLKDAEYDLADAQKKYNDIASETEFNLDTIKESLAAGGDVAQEAMGQIMTALMSVEDEQERYILGQTIMGTMWEDLGEDTVKALMNTEGAISGTVDAMGQMDAAAYDTLESSLSQLGRTIKAEVIQPIADKLIPVAKESVDFVTSKVAPAVDWCLDNLPTLAVVLSGIAAAVVAFKWSSLVGGIKKAGVALKALGAANPIGLIIIAVTALVAAFVYLWNNCEGFRNFWINLWEKIKGATSAAVEWIKNCWESIKAFFTGDNPIARYFQLGWENIKLVWSIAVSYFQTLWENIKLVFSAVKSVLSGDFAGAWSAIKQIFANWGSFFSGLFDKVSQIFGNIKEMISIKINAAKDVVRAAIDKIKGFFDFDWNLPKIKLPHFKISGEFSIAPPSVPKLSIDWYKDGGIMTQPTIFGASGNTLMAGGEAGAEAVLPLSVLWSQMEGIMKRILNSPNSTGGTPDEGLTATAGRLLTLDDFSLGSLADGTSVVIYYDFSGFTWSPQIQGGGTGNDEDDLMARLRAHEAEFFEWLEEFIHMREVAQYA